MFAISRFNRRSYRKEAESFADYNVLAYLMILEKERNSATSGFTVQLSLSSPLFFCLAVPEADIDKATDDNTLVVVRLQQGKQGMT